MTPRLLANTKSLCRLRRSLPGLWTSLVCYSISSERDLLTLLIDVDILWLFLICPAPPCLTDHKPWIGEELFSGVPRLKDFSTFTTTCATLSSNQWDGAPGHRALEEVTVSSCDFPSYVQVMSYYMSCGPDCVPDSPRAVAMIIFRLVTGHDCLRAYLIHFNLTASPNCVFV
ncbi:hypothetical protein CDAR_66131 [Caerostris darwini]|uniref:Uncharacterized protein n=1 Tax=Caerostris darwini TaxID=1538125 RepID=A0AAV4TZJ3_9ARAC|nr:hypothetical protein CDAR_66131 [Caerostris darwini]